MPSVGAKVGSTKTPAPPPSSSPKPEVQLITVTENSDGQRLDNFLIRELKGAPKTLAYRIIRSGEVRVNKGRASADTRLNVGDVVRVPPLRLSSSSTQTSEHAHVPAKEFPVIYEDEHVLVINKPAGVAVHGGSGVSFGVIEQLRQARPTAKFLELVHRLDKETSGLLVIAKKRRALTVLQDQFRQRQTGKTYAALVWGQWPPTLKVIDVALHKFLTAEGERRVAAVDAGHPDGRRSISLVKVVKQFAQHALLDVTIKTGRTHQIRVHLAQAQHPIVGDEKYGNFENNRAIARGALRFDRMFLHARHLSFQHPETGQVIELVAELPDECQDLLRKL